MESATMNTPIPLIVGAGPTGLMLSLWLQKFSIPHRIVDAAPTTGTASRATILHARSIELYRQLGLADELIAIGSRVKHFAIHHNGVLKAKINSSEGGRGISLYPFILSITQDEQEALLERTIIKRGGKVDRNTRVVSVEEDQNTGFVNVTLNHDDKNEKFLASYVIGCDGAHSSVRSLLHIEMPGGTYDKFCFVADVFTTGYPSRSENINLCLSDEDFIMVIPLPHTPGRARLIGFVPNALEEAKSESVTFEDIRPIVKRNAKDLIIEKVNWFSRYKVHYRAAEHFKKNRVFLCGDAAHIHSPVGGQGMNTGLGDASNLAWKIAAVHRGAPTSLLDTYPPERVPFAKKLVATTDYVFTKMIGDDWLSILFRNYFWPYIMPFLLSIVNLAPKLFKRTSQIELEYNDSPLSLDLGNISNRSAARAGNRLPWVEHADNNGNDNHSYLKTAEWQAHGYGETEGWVQEFLVSENISFHTFDWQEVMRKAGLQESVVYLIRPDGYIGVTIRPGVTQIQTESQLSEYFEKWGVGLAKK